MPTSKPRVGIAGLGTVGAEVARQIIEHHHGKVITLAGVCARDKSRNRNIPLAPDMHWYDNPQEMINDCDILVELMGGINENVDQFIQETIKADKKIVTANKAYLAENIDLVGNPQISFEAAVAGGIPIIATLKDCVRANRITKITGILNGTCNYILTELEKSPVPFNEVVAAAQQAGFAEADPTLDISGADTLQKSLILARLAFGEGQVRTMCKGLDENTPALVAKAQQNGDVIRLVSDIERIGDDVEINVSLQTFSSAHDFASVRGAQNAIGVKGDPMVELFIKGYGAGAKPTASAVLADILQQA